MIVVAFGDFVASARVFRYLLAAFPVLGAYTENLHGSPEEEGIEIASEHAPRASRSQGSELCRMLELRRDEAPASCLRRLRSLRRPRGDGDGNRVGVSRPAGASGH